MTYANLDFIDRLLNHRNALFCILGSTQYMLHFKPRFDEIDRLLKNTITTSSWTARYYDLLMTVTSVYPIE